MALVIMVEHTTIRDEQLNIDALQFDIVREIGMHETPIARFVIPTNANENTFLADVYVSYRALDLVGNDVKYGTDLNWLNRGKYQKLVDKLWQAYNRINYCNQSPGEGFQLLYEIPPGVKLQPEPATSDSEEVQRKRAIALLAIREPEIGFDIQEVRECLFKLKKEWRVVPTRQK